MEDIWRKSNKRDKIKRLGVVVMESITIKDVARICNVSVSTVSRAINNSPDISSETREKIMQVVRDNYFVPNNNARNLKRSESKTIAVLIKGIDNAFFSPIISTLEKEIQKRKYTFILQRVEQNQDEIDVAIALEKEKKLKGIIFLGGYFSHAKDKLLKMTVPYVLCTVGVKDKLPCRLSGAVSVDDVAESRKMVDYLCSLGHKDIAIITSSPQDESIGTMRFDGYRQALEKNGIEFDEKLAIIINDEQHRYSMKNGYLSMKKLLNTGKKITAVFAITDSLAIGACKALNEAGLRVPEDISVAGYDGLELAEYYIPSLTTIAQPVERIAKETLKILFKIISGDDTETYKVFQGELIVGGSTKRINQ